jgi:hypothetical protein
MTNDSNNLETIDITPKWEAVVDLFLIILKPQCDFDTLQYVRRELKRIAVVIDETNDTIKGA